MPGSTTTWSSPARQAGAEPMGRARPQAARQGRARLEHHALAGPVAERDPALGQQRRLRGTRPRVARGARAQDGPAAA